MKRFSVRHWQTFLRSLTRFGLDLLFPPQCVGCGRLGSLFCPHCAQQVPAVPAAICHRCGRVQATPTVQCSLCIKDDGPLIWARAAALYEEPLRSAIQAFKYEGQRELAKALARYLIAVYTQFPWQDRTAPLDACLAIPLYADREAERGYNQSALLAENFSERTGIPYRREWLRRVRSTESQARLSAVERLQNVDGAFAATPDVSGKRLLLIDDVTTTGATLKACAAALDEAGATAIYGLVLATPQMEQ